MAEHTELTVETMLKVVAQKFQVAPEDITSEKASQDVLEARWAFVYLAFRLVHAARMKKAWEENPERVRGAGFAAMRYFERQIYDELRELFNADYADIRQLDGEAIKLRETNRAFYDKTEAIWVEIDEAYDLDAGQSGVIWIDRCDTNSGDEGSQSQEGC